VEKKRNAQSTIGEQKRIEHKEARVTYEEWGTLGLISGKLGKNQPIPSLFY